MIPRQESSIQITDTPGTATPQVSTTCCMRQISTGHGMTECAQTPCSPPAPALTPTDVTKHLLVAFEVTWLYDQDAVCAPRSHLVVACSSRLVSPTI
eukprot:3336169-Rhodomonas_salina.3